MKKLLLAALSAVCLLSLAFAACQRSVTLVDFDVRDEDETAYIEIGEEYTVPTGLAVDSAGKEIVGSVRVYGEDGKDVPVTQGKCKPPAVGNYTVEYTFAYNKSDVAKKHYTLNVYDLTGPVVECDLGENNYAPEGGSFDISAIAVTDNSGETISPEIKVYFGDKEIQLSGTTVEFKDKGTYRIEVNASDSSGNETTAVFRVFTVMDAESGISPYNQYYETSASDEFAHSGSYSYKVGLFMNNYNWFDDKAMLGDVKILSDKTYEKLSFWIYFGVGEGYESLSFSVNKLYYDMKVYDAYGDEVELNWQDKYEFFNGSWYRWEVDVTKGLVDGYGAITETLNDFQIYLGVWDLVGNNNAITNGSYVYIDDLKLVGSDYDFSGEYEEKPAIEPDKYEKGEKLLDATSFDAMVKNVFEADCGWVKLESADETPVVYGEYTFFRGSAENPEKFDKAGSTYQSLGHTENAENPEAKKAYTNNWKFYYGFNDAFVYAFKAGADVFVGFEIPETVDGWITGTLKIYIADAEGKMTEVFSKSLADKTSLDGLADYELEKGETIYFEFLYPSSEMRNVGNPPYFALYQALEKKA